jgi:hypothetical protein
MGIDEITQKLMPLHPRFPPDSQGFRGFSRSVSGPTSGPRGRGAPETYSLNQNYLTNGGPFRPVAVFMERSIRTGTSRIGATTSGAA